MNKETITNEREKTMKLSQIKSIQNIINEPAVAFWELGYKTKKEAIDLYNQYNGKDWKFYHDCAFHEGSLPSLLPEADISPTKRMVKTSITTNYESHCSEWGAYNPNRYFKIVIIHHRQDYAYRTESKTLLGHGSTNSTLRKSEYYNLKRLNKMISEERIVCGKYVEVFGYIAQKGSVSFHGRTKEEAKEGLIEKTIKTETNAEKLNIERLKNGKLITISKLVKLFGWCESGIEDFIEECLPELCEKKSIRNIPLKNMIRENDMSYARENYRPEFAQLLRYIK